MYVRYSTCRHKTTYVFPSLSLLVSSTSPLGRSQFNPLIAVRHTLTAAFACLCFSVSDVDVPLSSYSDCTYVFTDHLISFYAFLVVYHTG